MPIDVSQHGPLAVLTIEHPPLNLFDRQLLYVLQHAVLRSDPGHATYQGS
ncbi:MAG: hypothetical protein ACYCSI_12525 [Solirubrobacteraceae bacterium]